MKINVGISSCLLGEQVRFDGSHQPITLVNHYTRMLKEPYLLEQHYPNPHPVKLKLRNHV